MKRSSIVTGLACMVMGLSAAPQLAVAGGTKSSPSKTEETKKTDTKSKDTAKTSTEKAAKPDSGEKSATEKTTFPLIDDDLSSWEAANLDSSSRFGQGAMALSLSHVEMPCGYTTREDNYMAVGQQGTRSDAGQVKLYNTGSRNIGRFYRSQVFTGASHLDSVRGVTEAERTAAGNDQSYGKAVELSGNTLLIASDQRVESWAVNPTCYWNQPREAVLPEKLLRLSLDADDLYCEDSDWDADALVVHDIAYATHDDRVVDWPFNDYSRFVVAAISDGNAACLVAHSLDGQSSDRVSMPRPEGLMQLAPRGQGVAVTTVTECRSRDGVECDAPSTTLDEYTFTGIPTATTSVVLDDVRQVVLDRYDVSLNRATRQIELVQEAMGEEIAEMDFEECVDTCQLPMPNSNGERTSRIESEAACEVACGTVDVTTDTCDGTDVMTPWVFLPGEDSDEDNWVGLGDTGTSGGLPDPYAVVETHRDLRYPIREYKNRAGAQVAATCSPDWDGIGLPPIASYAYVGLPHYGLVYGGSTNGQDWLNETRQYFGSNSSLGSEMVAFGDYLFVTEPGVNTVHAFHVE